MTSFLWAHGPTAWHFLATGVSVQVCGKRQAVQGAKRQGELVGLQMSSEPTAVVPGLENVQKTMENHHFLLENSL